MDGDAGHDCTHDLSCTGLRGIEGRIVPTAGRFMHLTPFGETAGR